MRAHIWSGRVAVGIVTLTAVASLGSATPAGATVAPPDAPPGSATTYQINALHDGYSADQLSLPLERSWSHNFGAQVSYPLIVSGRVFVVTSTPGGAPGTYLSALNATSGDVLWGPKTVSGSTAHSAGIAADGANVYAISPDGLLQAIDQATGATVWSRSLQQRIFTSPPTVRAGIVYVGGTGSGGTVFAVDAGTGTILWSAAVQNGDHSSPAVTADGVYVSYACEFSYSFAPTTGASQWTHTTGCAGGGGRTPVVHGTSVYVRDDAGMGPAILSTATGVQTGTFASTTAPAFSAQRMFAVSGGALRAFDVATGVLQWTQAGDGHLVTAPIVVGNAVAVGSSSGEVSLFDNASGTQLWSADAGSAIATPDEHNQLMLIGLAESAGTLFVPSTNTLVAYRPHAVHVTPSTSDFGKHRIGTARAARTVTIANVSNQSAALSNIAITGVNSTDFSDTTDCFPTAVPRILAAGASCHVTVSFVPTTPGTRSATLVVRSSEGGRPDSVSLTGTGTEGYILATARGELGTFGDAVSHGDAAHIGLAAPIISLATTRNGNGYWLLGRDGGIFSYGDARFYGSTGAMRLNKPIVAMAATPGNRGYWLVASDGGVFSFGDAGFHGSAATIPLRRPITGMATTPTGHGYWLVADDGGTFAYGDAQFYGATATTHSPAPITAIVPTPSAHGYWLQARDGRVYPFGDARGFGSAPAGDVIVGMASTPDGRGYWEVSRTGAVFSFGDARPYGGLGGVGLSDIIGIAPTAPPLFGH